MIKVPIFFKRQYYLLRIYSNKSKLKINSKESLLALVKIPKTKTYKLQKIIFKYIIIDSFERIFKCA